MKLRANAENVTTQEKIIASTAKQAKMTAFESIQANPFTRVHGRPTQRDYKILKVEDITYAWSKNLTDNYGLLTNIMGVDEHDDLTGIATYLIPNKPAS